VSQQVLAGLDDLVVQARGLVGTGERRVLIGLTGSPGVGTTTLVQALAAALLRRLTTDESSIGAAPAVERDLEQPLAGAIPVPPPPASCSPRATTCRSMPSRGPRSQLSSERSGSAPDDETRRTRLVARHVVSGKEPASAAHWMRRRRTQRATDCRVPGTGRPDRAQVGPGPRGRARVGPTRDRPPGELTVVVPGSISG
jgi:hypothetical protein